MKGEFTYNFITDIDKDIDHFIEQYLNNHDELRDIDTFSPALRKYQQCLYRRNLPIGVFFDLEIGRDATYDYLCWDNPIYYGDDLKKSRFASDSIINMQERYYQPDFKIPDYKNKMRKYVKDGATIGGEIIFPKHPNSINVSRGRNPKIKDRFDLTLECIRRFYNGEQSPLYDALKADEKFFHLFKDFDSYVKFFFLDAYVTSDGSIKFFIGGDNFRNGTDGFADLHFNPLPTTTEEWEELYKNQMDCLYERNEQIYALFPPDNCIKQ